VSNTFDTTGDAMPRADYRLRTSTRVLLLAIYCFFLAVGVAALVSMVRRHDRGGMVFLVVWAAVLVVQARWALFRMPWRIELSDHAVVFLSRSGRRREIDYGALRSVSPAPFDLNRQSARWVSTSGTVWSMTAFTGWRSLLNEVERRAPQAQID
jgi:hypothetical protein